VGKGFYSDWAGREDVKNRQDMRHTGWLAAILLLICSVTVPSAWAAKISFNEAWQEVLRSHDSLAAGRANIERTQHLQRAARDLYFPKVDLTARYTRLDQAVELSPEEILRSMPAGDTVGRLLTGLGSTYGLSPAQINAGLTSRIADRDMRTSSVTGLWPIYAGGRIDAAQDIAKNQVDEARFQLDMDRQKQFETLAQYYFGIVLAQEVLETKAKVKAALQKHWDHAVLLERQGQTAHVERLQAEASLAKAGVDETKARHDLEIGRAALHRMLKLQEQPEPESHLFINAGLPPLATFLDKTLAGHPGLGVYEAKGRQAEGLARVENGKYLPEVALFGSYNLYEDDNLAAELAPDWLVGVGISVPLVDRSGRSGNLGAARSMVRQIGSLRTQARQDLSLLVEKTYRQAQQAMEEYTGLGSSLTLAEENVRLREKAFDQGLSTSLDVVDSRLFLAGIQTQRSAASYTYVLSLARLLAMSGMSDSFSTYQHEQAIEVK